MDYAAKFAAYMALAGVFALACLAVTPSPPSFVVPEVRDNSITGITRVILEPGRVLLAQE